MDRDKGRRHHVTARQFFKDHRRFHTAKAHAAMFFADIDTGKAHFGSELKLLAREVFFFIPLGRVRQQFGLGKGAGRLFDGPLVFVQLEVHAVTLNPWSG